MPAERPNSSKDVRDLDPRDEAAQLEARGYTSDQIGERLGVPGSTVRNWRQNDDFRTKVDEVRRRLFDEATGRAADNMAAMVDVLTSIALDEGEESPVRVRAASIVLAEGQKLRDHTDLEERIAALEMAHQERAG